MSYDFRAIESRWQEYWDEHKSFRAEIDRSKPKYYVLDMFPYPSGDGLHVGHPEGYTATDILARYKRMKGFSVLHPMGWDAFGLPAERHAINTGVHPAKRTGECIANFKRQLKMLGFSYDWDREISTTDPKYFKWTQWIFLQLWNAWYDEQSNKARPISELEIPSEVESAGPLAVRQYRDDHRLAYLNEAPVNWCPELKIVLANEEVAEHVEAGREVVRLPMKQWMFRITKYAQRLLDDLSLLDWPEHVLLMQRNWVGRSDGAEVDFAVEGQDDKLAVFTTRPDTLYGATYMVLAPEHPMVSRLCTDESRGKVEAYIKSTALKSDRERQIEGAKGEKTGVFTGGYAINPVNGQKTPIWISDYVLMGYGTGAIMAVPAHDERDHAFAKAMDLPIIEVVSGGKASVQDEAFVGTGKAVNSGVIDGLETAAAKERMIEHLESQGTGRRRVTYKLRDWLFSRQRYWGEPFPLVHKEDGEVVAVSDDQLPVELPEVDDFNPSDSGEAPLARAKEWRKLPDGSLRETNTMPQWAGSCWYYLRFADPGNDDLPWSSDAEKYWLPVDLYVGGAEHAVLHLLYARFWHKALFDLGKVSSPEPFKKLVNQGMVLGATYIPKDPEKRRNAKGKVRQYLPKDVEEKGEGEFFHKESGEELEIQWDKMSKSRGNVVNPDEVISQYGADTMRLYEMFMGPLEQSAPWQTQGVTGCFKFLRRAHALFFGADADSGSTRAVSMVDGEGSERQRRLLHRTIAEVSERIERMSFNTAISSLMVYVRDILKGEDKELPRENAAKFCLLLAPFAPHLGEEIWRDALGNTDSLTYANWPEADSAMLQDDSWTVVVQINGKKRGELSLPSSLDRKAKDEILVRAKEDDTVKRHLEGQTIRREIYVPGKLVNFVV